MSRRTKNKKKQLTNRAKELLDRFGIAAQKYGWERDQGSEEGAAKAELNNEKAKTELATWMINQQHALATARNRNVQLKRDLDNNRRNHESDTANWNEECGRLRVELRETIKQLEIYKAAESLANHESPFGDPLPVVYRQCNTD